MHYIAVGILTFAGKAGFNKLLLSKLHGHKLPAAKYEAEASAVGARHIITFTVGR